MDSSEYPVKVTFNFKTEEEKQKFMSQLSDGWGEPYVNLHWDWSQKFDQVHDFDVDLSEEEGWL